MLEIGKSRLNPNNQPALVIVALNPKMDIALKSYSSLKAIKTKIPFILC